MNENTMDNLTLAVAILIVIGFVFQAVYSLAVDKEFEKCFENEYVICTDYDIMNPKLCEDLAIKKCEEKL